MSNPETRRSPLGDLALPPGLRELPFRAQIDLRLDPGDGAARQAVESVVGPLPVETNTVHGGADAAVLWLGPDEWLIVGPPGGETALESQLREALAAVPDRPVAIVDVSANRTTLELTRPDGPDILAGGCPVDLDPRVFRPGHCAQTLVARANVVVWRLDDVAGAPRFRLLVRPSFAAYLAAWLTDAMGPPP